MSLGNDLIQGYLDGVLTAEQEAELNAWVKQDPANAMAFASAVRLHDRLREAVRASHQISSTRSLPLPEPLGPVSDSRRPWLPTTLAGSLGTAVLLLLIVLWWWRPNSVNAATELARLIETPTADGDRTYRVSSLDSEPEPVDERRPPLDGATLHVRTPDQYVLIRRFPNGEEFVTGSDGVRSWAIRPTGAIRVSNDPLRFRGPLPGHQHGVPFADIRSDLVHLRDAYAVHMLKSQAGLRGLGMTRKPTAFRGPREVELWYNPRTLDIHRMVLRGLPRARGGPDSVAVELIDQRSLGPDFFQHTTHHAPDRRVIEED